jgi:ankyrin repeat protein
LSKIGAFASVLVISFGAAGASDLDAKLLEVAQKVRPAEIRELLAAGADANARAGDGSTPMLYAAHFGDVSSVQALLGAKGDPNLTNRWRRPMHEAALRAETASASNTSTPVRPSTWRCARRDTLMLASRTSGVDAVRLLIEHGANVNVVEQWQGQTLSCTQPRKIARGRSRIDRRGRGTSTPNSDQ